MISDDKIEAALDYLAGNVDAAAQARANKAYLSEYRKTLKADLMNQSNEQSEAAKERFAYSHPEYKEFLEGFKEAVRQDAMHEFRRSTYETTVSAWQTMIKAQQGPRP